MEPPAFPYYRAPTRLWVLLTGTTALLVMAVYAFMFYGSFFIESNPLKNQFDVVYSKVTADGTVAWYDYEKGRLTEHPAPAPGNVIGLTRSSTGTYMAVQPSIIATDSSIYRYKDGSYSLVYKDAEHLLFGLSVSKDDAYIGFVAASKDGRTMSVYDLAQKVRTDLGPGSVTPQFLTVQGKTALIYTQGMNLVMRSKNGDGWSEPQILFTSMQLSISQFATNGMDRYAFTDPLTSNILEWQIISIMPLQINPLVVHEKKRGMPAFGGETLYTYQYGLPVTSSTFSNLVVTEAATGDTVTLRPAWFLGSTGSVFLFAKP